MPTCHRARALGAVAASLSWVALLTTTRSAPVPAGLDYLETVPSATYVDFSSNPIPADFFDPGSDPFTGRVNFQGVPINPATHGTTDTIVQRMETAKVNPPRPTDTIPIELVALNLVSVNPITVTYHGGMNPEQWTINVTLPIVQPQSIGSMTIMQTSPKGGTFDSTLPVRPMLTFTRISDSAVRSLTLPDLPFQASSVMWSYKADPSLLTDKRFCAGCDPLTGLATPFNEQAALAAHGVKPAAK